MNNDQSYHFSLTQIIAMMLLIILLTLGLGGFLLYTNRARLAQWIADAPSTGENHLVQRSGNDEVQPIAQTVAEVLPAVVSVVVTKDIPTREVVYEDVFPFFGGGFQIPRYIQGAPQEREVGGGSGFFVSSNGMIVTNKHVVADEDAKYSIVDNDGVTHQVTVVARDPLYDIAILQVDDAEDNNHPYLELGDISTVQLGEITIAIGNALAEYDNSVSVGVVSGLARSIVAEQSETISDLIQTDAAINPGNSGGPVLDINGKVIGVSVAIAARSQGIGFALPVDVVKSVIASVSEHGEIIRPYLGVRYTTIDPQVQEEFDLPVSKGAFILPTDNEHLPSIVLDSPADKAGLRAGDILISMGGTVITREHSLASIIRRYSVGDTITVVINREGQQKNISVTLEKLPDSL